MEEILQIDKNNIEAVAQFILPYKNAPEKILPYFKGKLSSQDTYTDCIKYTIKNDSAINTVILDVKNKDISNVAFYGSLNINYNDLVVLFGEAIEYYERYDDTYEFFFKINSATSCYIKLFIPSNEKQENWKEKKLTNLSVFFDNKMT
ncbi:MAG TPA: hypothetical protein VK718_00220 [Ferruginibacter sp.]|jgi:hypothetical protein|nr:hypothetical protein [Ferruginibacter sp.]